MPFFPGFSEYISFVVHRKYLLEARLLDEDKNSNAIRRAEKLEGEWKMQCKSTTQHLVAPHFGHANEATAYGGFVWVLASMLDPLSR